MREKKKKEVIGSYKYDRSVEMKLIKIWRREAVCDTNALVFGRIHTQEALL